MEWKNFASGETPLSAENLNKAFDEKLDKTGGTISGDIIPDTSSRKLGSPQKSFVNAYFKDVSLSNVLCNNHAFSFGWDNSGLFKTIIDGSETRYTPATTRKMNFAWDDSSGRLRLVLDGSTILYINVSSS